MCTVSSGNPFLPAPATQRVTEEDARKASMDIRNFFGGVVNCKGASPAPAQHDEASVSPAATPKTPKPKRARKGSGPARPKGTMKAASLRRSPRLTKTVEGAVDAFKVLCANAGGDLARTRVAKARPRKKSAKAAPKKRPTSITIAKVSVTSSVPTRQHEQFLWDNGFERVAGVDEAGRGPLVGPVVAAACVLPPDVSIDGVQDSKQLSEEEREACFEAITSHPRVTCAWKRIDAAMIDEINILQATMRAMEGAVAGLPTPPSYVLVDGNRVPQGLDCEGGIPAEAIVKGDGKSAAIAAASIVAKVSAALLRQPFSRTFLLLCSLIPHARTRTHTRTCTLHLP